MAKKYIPSDTRHKGSPPLTLECSRIQKVADGRFLYHFALTAPATRPLRGLLTVRLYPKGARLMGTLDGNHSIDLPAGQRIDFSVESPILIENPLFRYHLDEFTNDIPEYSGQVVINAPYEELTVLIDPQPVNP